MDNLRALAEAALPPDPTKDQNPEYNNQPRSKHGHNLPTPEQARVAESYGI